MSLPTLIQRLEEAEGPDRELDREIFCFVNPFSVPFKTIKSMVYVNHSKGVLVPEFTASLDAAIGLVERVLPGWGIDHLGDDVSASVDATKIIGATVEIDNFAATDKPTPIQGQAATRPLALCLALLKALQHKEQAE